MRKIWRYFSRLERILWSGSVLLILLAFAVFGRTDYMTLAASLLGATSLIFSAKGHPVGQLLMVVFSVLYGIIAWRCAYYGEMITYLGMTGPMALLALVAWLRHPFGSGHQVAVNRVRRGELLGMLGMAALVTWGFYYILDFFHTANIALSTLSVTTSFIAVYLTFRRSPLFALAYAANDLVLIALWVLASLEEREYVPVVICFVTFLANDFYGFISWRRMYALQRQVLRDGLKQRK